MTTSGGRKKPVSHILLSLLTKDTAARAPLLTTRVTLSFLSGVWVKALLQCPQATLPFSPYPELSGPPTG